MLFCYKKTGLQVNVCTGIYKILLRWKYHEYSWLQAFGFFKLWKTIPCSIAHFQVDPNKKDPDPQLKCDGSEILVDLIPELLVRSKPPSLFRKVEIDATPASFSSTRHLSKAALDTKDIL